MPVRSMHPLRLSVPTPVNSSASVWVPARVTSCAASRPEPLTQRNRFHNLA